MISTPCRSLASLACSQEKFMMHSESTSRGANTLLEMPSCCCKHLCCTVLVLCTVLVARDCGGCGRAFFSARLPFCLPTCIFVHSRDDKRSLFACLPPPSPGPVLSTRLPSAWRCPQACCAWPPAVTPRCLPLARRTARSRHDSCPPCHAMPCRAVPCIRKRKRPPAKRMTRGMFSCLHPCC